MKKNFLFKKGFTLIESMVAITMLSVVIASTMTLAQNSIASNSYSQAQVTANYLAGEAIEYIRNKRDQNFITDNANWLSGITDISTGCTGATGCTVDTINSTITACPGGGCVPLKFVDNISSGYYQNSVGGSSVFTRTVNIVEINSNEIVVKVTISGASGYFKRTPLVVVEHLFRWYQP